MLHRDALLASQQYVIFGCLATRPSNCKLRLDNALNHAEQGKLHNSDRWYKDGINESADNCNHSIS